MWMTSFLDCKTWSKFTLLYESRATLWCLPALLELLLLFLVSSLEVRKLTSSALRFLFIGLFRLFHIQGYWKCVACFKQNFKEFCNENRQFLLNVILVFCDFMKNHTDALNVDITSSTVFSVHMRSLRTVCICRANLNS